MSCIAGVSQRVLVAKIDATASPDAISPPKYAAEQQFIKKAPGYSSARYTCGNARGENNALIIEPFKSYFFDTVFFFPLQKLPSLCTALQVRLRNGSWISATIGFPFCKT